MIIQFYSDSLGLPRPGYVNNVDRYVIKFVNYLKSNKHCDVYLLERAFGGATINKLYNEFAQDAGYFSEKPKRLILHVGVCDCAPRPVSKRLRYIISKLPDFLKIRIVSFLHNNRAKILKLGLGSVNVNATQFRFYLKKLLTEAIIDFDKIHVINICPTNSSTEIHSPGFSKNINTYNDIIKSVIIDLNSDKVKLIDVYKIVIESSLIDNYIIESDGHHIKPLLHDKIAQLLIEDENAVCFA